MRSIAIFSAIIFWTFFACSCSPDPVDPPTVPNLPGPPVQLEGDSTFIKMVVDIDIRALSVGDTIKRYDFFYDAQQRLTKIETLDANKIKTEVRELLYNGEDSLPYKLSTTTTNGFFRANFFTYERGIIVKDSLKYYRNGTNTADLVTTYSNIGGNSYFIYTVRTEYSPYRQFGADSIYMHPNIVDGNPVAINDSSYYCSDGIKFGDVWITNSDIEYDNKPTPYNRYVLPYPVFARVIQQYIFYRPGINNPLKKTSVAKPDKATSSYTITTNYSYKYGANGLPIEITQTEVTQNITTIFVPFKRIITYGRL